MHLIVIPSSGHLQSHLAIDETPPLSLQITAEFPHATWDASTNPPASSAMSAPLSNILFIFLLLHPTSTQRCEVVLWGCPRLLCLQILHMYYLS